MKSAPMSLDLDERQRAMLQEMHVKVWWPQSVGQPELHAVEQVPAASMAMPKPPEATPAVRAGALPVAEFAPKIVANKPYDTKAIGSIYKKSLPQALHSGDVAAMDWPTLQQAVVACQACALCEKRKNTVFGVGQAPTGENLAPQVDWLIVGEAPGENEDLSGEPFVGQAGKLLDNMLKAMGLARHHNVYIANVVKCRPPGNRNPELSEVAQCEPYLRRQIELLQPKVILAMGRYAVNALLQQTVPDVQKLPLGKLRGQVHGYQSADRVVPVIATYHPAYLLRNLPEKAKSWADLCLALDVMARPT